MVTPMHRRSFLSGALGLAAAPALAAMFGRHDEPRMTFTGGSSNMREYEGPTEIRFWVRSDECGTYIFTDDNGVDVLVEDFDFAQYEGTVFVDSSPYPCGTPAHPVSTLEEAREIASHLV